MDSTQVLLNRKRPKLGSLRRYKQKDLRRLHSEGLIDEHLMISGARFALVR
ncbi:hypothetical protein FHS72_001856 [Loktanella ponticola]|uniref:Uncharacterized protein n=1 Tax=Yoonia ponticola TaxID=1524255 RepID=A0A7W9BKJ0_9RHOB|nr:hypothetical protein [Yoonia ponticola]